MNSLHLNTAQCSKVADRKHHRVAVEEAYLGTVTAFGSHGRPLTNVAALKYPGRILADIDYDWLEVVDNLRKARKKWAGISTIFGHWGVYA